MPSAARSAPNIALIKYWGNRDDELRLPAADSLSMTLDAPAVEITVNHADRLSVQSFQEDGTERPMTEKHLLRFEKHLELTKRYLRKLGIPEALPSSLSMEIRSAIPPSIGLASSAAVFSALAEAIAGLISPHRALTRAEVSVIARLGSGSAARGVFGGWSALLAGEGKEIDSSRAEQIADEHHWPLHDIIIVPTREEKKRGSTEGHSLAWTSPLFEERLREIPRRMSECNEAITRRNFEKLQRAAEEDARDLHHIAETSTPSLQYLTQDTHRLIREIEQFRVKEHLPVLYTMDAGPTVHLFCPEESVGQVRQFAHAQSGCTIFEARSGGGAYLL